MFLRISLLMSSNQKDQAIFDPLKNWIHLGVKVVSCVLMALICSDANQCSVLSDSQLLPPR